MRYLKVCRFHDFTSFQYAPLFVTWHISNQLCTDSLLLWNFVPCLNLHCTWCIFRELFRQIFVAYFVWLCFEHILMHKTSPPPQRMAFLYLKRKKKTEFWVVSTHAVKIWDDLNRELIKLLDFKIILIFLEHPVHWAFTA